VFVVIRLFELTALGYLQDEPMTDDGSSLRQATTEDAGAIAGDPPLTAQLADGEAGVAPCAGR